MNAELLSWRSVRRAGSIVLLVSAATRPASAQSDNRVAAEALFQEARKLLEAGQYAEACEKLASSERLDPAVGTLLNLARCYEKLGRTATAWGTYREAIAAAKRAGQTEREKSARRAADALEPTLPRLTIDVSPPTDDSKPEVTRDGVAILPELWGAAVPVDPGEHTVSAAAPGRKPWSTKVTVDARTSKNIVVPALERVEVHPGPPTAEPVAASGGTTVFASPPPAHETTASTSGGWNAQRTFALIATGLGLAGGAVAVVELLSYNSDKSQADSLCPNACQMQPHAQAVSLLSDAKSAETIGIVGASVGGAALVTGAILWFTAPSGNSAASALRVSPLAAPQALGIRVAGAW
jgi:hypothetical protein